MEEPTKKDRNLIERLRKGSFPTAAIAGAFISFADAARAVQKQPPVRGSSAGPFKPALPAANLELQYSQSGIIKGQFRKTLFGVALGPGDRIFALGDGDVRVYENGDRLSQSWRAPDDASCLAVGRDGKVYIGAGSRVHIFDKTGIRLKTFDTGTADRPATITAIKALPEEILVADAASRYILRYSHSGKRLGEIGNKDKVRGFVLPNKSLDIDVDSKGTVVATDSGRHRVSAWTTDGGFIHQFGKFGMARPEDFVGCCNPVSVAFSPDGKIVTAEKVIPRVKVFDNSGKLLGLIGPEHFDAKCTRLHLAIDSTGRIFVADPVRLEVKSFKIAGRSGSREGV